MRQCMYLCIHMLVCIVYVCTRLCMCTHAQTPTNIFALNENGCTYAWMHMCRHTHPLRHIRTPETCIFTHHLTSTRSDSEPVTASSVYIHVHTHTCAHTHAYRLLRWQRARRIRDWSRCRARQLCTCPSVSKHSQQYTNTVSNIQAVRWTICFYLSA